MTIDDGRDDDVLVSLEALKAYDVSRNHARRLRQRCHSRLRTDTIPDPAETATATLFQRIVGPAILGAWSVAYLAEIFRRAAAVWLLP